MCRRQALVASETAVGSGELTVPSARSRPSDHTWFRGMRSSPRPFEPLVVGCGRPEVPTRVIWTHSFAALRAGAIANPQSRLRVDGRIDE